MIITSNKRATPNSGVLSEKVLATTILDRLLHHCGVININGSSYGLKDRLTTLAVGGDETMPRSTCRDDT